MKDLLEFSHHQIDNDRTSECIQIIFIFKQLNFSITQFYLFDVRAIQMKGVIEIKRNFIENSCSNIWKS